MGKVNVSTSLLVYSQANVAMFCVQGCLLWCACCRYPPVPGLAAVSCSCRQSLEVVMPAIVSMILSLGGCVIALREKGKLFRQ
jgi:hypothetical protein